VTPVLANLGSLPSGANLAGYQLLWGGDQLFSLDVPAALPEPLTVEPRDVVRYDGASYSLEFDGSAHGVPSGTAIDAVTTASDGDLLVSFDTAVSLSGQTFHPEDLVRFDSGGGTFSSFFDGSAAGVAAGLDLDAAYYLVGPDTLLLSFDGSGMLGGVGFDDEDVLEREILAGNWALAVDASASEPAWSPANLSALYAIPAGDTDSDTLSDLAELRTHGTNPADDDTDDDGLDDGEEVGLGTEPTNADTDDDDVCDGGNAVGGICDTAGPDNCPFVMNAGQANSDFLPAGDACQCGDIDGDFRVYPSDLALARAHLVGKAITGDITYCNVVGDYAPEEDGSDCDVADIYALSRYIAGEPVTLGNVCKPYFGGP